MSAPLAEAGLTASPIESGTTVVSRSGGGDRLRRQVQVSVTAILVRMKSPLTALRKAPRATGSALGYLPGDPAPPPGRVPWLVVGQL